MKLEDVAPAAELIQARLDRRRFFRQAGLFGLGAAATGLAVKGAAGQAPTPPGPITDQQKDTAAEIFTAALIAEDLATTFYYNALVGSVIQDPNLAGPGGSANNVTSGGNLGNVQYVQAALSEEISHANLFRSLLGLPDPSHDPVQTFYFPRGSFDTLAAFTGLLDALENAFIGAYLNAIQEFAFKAAVAPIIAQYYPSDTDNKYTATQFEYFAKVSASIMGIECEHRVLGRVISNSNPANNLNYEQTDGITAVYNGTTSAVVALTPFLTSSTGPAYSLATALANQSTVSIATTGVPPS
jgi:hypothetical protein